MLLDTEGAITVANAIIEQAAKDYRKALADDNKDKISELERFFRGEWYHLLTKLDPELLISMIKKEMNIK